MALTDQQQAQALSYNKTATDRLKAMTLSSEVNRGPALEALAAQAVLLSPTEQEPPPPTNGGNVLRSDPCTDPDPANLWGSTTGDLNGNDRHVLKTSGGPNNGPYRQLTVKDGDSMGFSGERAELGNNNRSDGLASPSNRSGTFWLGKSGKTEVIKYSIRLPSNFPTSGSGFQNITQWKHACPCAGASSDQPELTLQVRSGNFCLYGNTGTAVKLWSTPVIRGSWVPIEWQITWGKTSTTGKVRLKIGDKDSGSINRVTQATISGTPMDSHLRVGIYHDKSYPATSIDIGPVTVEAA